MLAVGYFSWNDFNTSGGIAFLEIFFSLTSALIERKRCLLCPPEEGKTILVSSRPMRMPLAIRMASISDVELRGSSSLLSICSTSEQKVAEECKHYRGDNIMIP